ncbi:auxin efflux carrier [Flagelloscypha sp. PMI_526]|nr:auxin efflux carrier [Flagelloscypha sp. PMI_526]
MLSAGALIWISIRPLLRLAICAGGGFAITKADIFPPTAARGAGQIMLNMTIPSLMFSKIVTAFAPENIHVLGPLVLVAVIYHILGFVLTWLIKQFFWVPHRMRNGILVAGMFGNVGDIPISVLMSITASAPFSGAADQTLAVAYISAFILIFVLLLFPFGGHHLIARDFKGPDYEAEEVREAMRLKRKAMLSGSVHYFANLLRTGKKSDERDPEKHETTSTGQSNPGLTFEKSLDDSDVPRPPMQRKQSDGKHVSFFDDTDSTVANMIASPSTSRAPTEIMSSQHARFTSPTPTIVEKSVPTRPGTPHTETTLHHNAEPPTPRQLQLSPTKAMGRQRWIMRFKSFCRSLAMPSSIAILLSFPIAIIAPLKALFVHVPGTYMPNAPDGQPPLAFIMDAAQFIGAASVPIGLICLGSALARLKIPRGQWDTLPQGAIISVAITRMIILPILGTLICQALIRANLISKEDKVLQIVCIFLSCLPTATTQVTLTQVYSGTGESRHLAEFLIPQYILMFITMPALIFYALYYIF